jgi:putative membrane protein
MPPFTWHMGAHMAVVALAAPALALGVAGGRWDPVCRAPHRISPVVASMVELVTVWAWHAPGLHMAARSESWAWALEQITFLFAGLYLWVAALGGTGEQRRARASGGITGLLLTLMHMTLLGALLALSNRVVYRHHHHGPSLLSPLHDQQLGGAVMIVMGGLAYLVGGLWLVGDVLRARVTERP